MPERKGRFTLPGGKPAFAPGWNDPIPITDEGENDDTPPPCLLTVTVAGTPVVVSAPVLLQREATFRYLGKGVGDRGQVRVRASHIPVSGQGVGGSD